MRLRAMVGEKAALSLSSRMLSTLLKRAASISVTSGWPLSVIIRQFSQTPQGVAVGPAPFPSLPTQHSAFVRVHTDDGIDGIGEASPMLGGRASLGIIRHDLAPTLIGKDPLDQAVLLDTLLHTCVKLGPEGALTGALAALDIALWDIKGKLFGQPIYKQIGGAWRTALPFYASISL